MVYVRCYCAIVMPTQSITEKEFNQAIQEGRDWLSDCFDDLPQDLSDVEILAGVDRHYDGKWQAFIEEMTR